MIIKRSFAKEKNRIPTFTSNKCPGTVLNEFEKVRCKIIYEGWFLFGIIPLYIREVSK